MISDFKIFKKNRVIYIKPFVKDDNIEKNIYKIYDILNRYENKYPIFIEDVPCCYVSDAFDHVILKNKMDKKKTRIKQCGLCRLNVICKGIEKDSVFYKNQNILTPILPVPNEIVFAVSNRCVLDCKMCKRNKDYLDLEFEHIIKTMDEAKKLGVKNIRFTGGEPIIYPQIIDLIKYSKKNGFYTILNSSLVCLKSYIKTISKYVDDLLVSLHGFDEKSEAEITGRNFFKLKISNIKYSTRFIKRVRIGSIITKKVINNFEEYLKIIPSEIKVWELYRPMVDYDFIKSNREFELDILGYNKLINKIRKANTKYKIIIANSIPFCLFNKYDMAYLLGARFDDGYTRIVMDSKGYFKPSYYIDVNIGINIYNSWKNKFLKNITWNRKVDKKCRYCLWFLKCLSGSRYVTYEKFGSYFCNDPLLENL